MDHICLFILDRQTHQNMRTLHIEERSISVQSDVTRLVQWHSVVVIHQPIIVHENLQTKNKSKS